jgi:hypothetical protein
VYEFNRAVNLIFSRMRWDDLESGEWGCIDYQVGCTSSLVQSEEGRKGWKVSRRRRTC